MNMSEGFSGRWQHSWQSSRTIKFGANPGRHLRTYELHQSYSLSESLRSKGHCKVFLVQPPRGSGQLARTDWLRAGLSAGEIAYHPKFE